MYCIFCKNESISSRSIEHIIPESLGNVTHTLPVGVVCDKCNNYFARKVEKPFLDSLYIQERRFYAGIPNKKERIPVLEGIHLQSLIPIQMMKKLKEPGISVGAAPNADESRWIKSLQNNGSGTLIMPIGTRPDDYVSSRFIAKVGLEVLAHRVLELPNGLNEIVNKPELDELRRYVRFGDKPEIWPMSFRQIYPADKLFSDGQVEYALDHEFDILVTDESEFYIVVAIFGDEYVLNLGGPEIEGYERWLAANNGISPLYTGKNKDS